MSKFAFFLCGVALALVLLNVALWILGFRPV